MLFHFTDEEMEKEKHLVSCARSVVTESPLNFGNEDLTFLSPKFTYKY